MIERRPRELGHGRHAGVLVPLASIPSGRSWGIGELGDLVTLAAWLDDAGLDLVQLLPINEMASGQASPYAAVSAMAIDPVYISLTDVDESLDCGDGAGISADDDRRLAALRSGSGIDFVSVRAVKLGRLNVAFERFLGEHWDRQTSRARDLSRYVEREGWWLDDHALFRAIQDDRSPGESWTSWPPALRDRESAAVASERHRLARTVLFHQYCQWVAEAQWQRARLRSPVKVMGDFPFMVALDSADVWAHQENFRLDATVGAPPDAFSDTGQDWGLPAYRWDVMQSCEFAWLRDRARRCAALFDGFRVDHIVGFYRTYVRPAEAQPPFFDPPEEPEQRALGERIVSVCRSPGAFVTVEDLGDIPDFVRSSLAELDLPGYRVLCWERRWDDAAQPFIAPESYPSCSIATSGTHDTSTLAGWWDEADMEVREQLLRLVDPEGDRAWEASRRYDADLRDALLMRLFASGSDIVIVPIQDLFGWRTRINVPGTVTESNWSFRLPWPVDVMVKSPEAEERSRTVRAWCERFGRVGKPPLG